MPTTTPAAPMPHARRLRRAPAGASALLASLLGALVLAAPAFAVVPSTPDSTYVANGYASSVARAGNTVYVGGNFTQIGPRTGGFVSLDPTSGAYDPHQAQTNGTVYAVASDGNGGEYIGGTFTTVGGVALSNAAHILASGAVDPTWAPNPDAAVRAIAVSASTVYLGGSFTHVENSTGTAAVPRNYAAAVDAVHGYDTGWNPNPSATVLALAIQGATVYLGGSFTTVENANGTGTDTRDYAAAVDATTGYDSPWNPNVNNPVQALAVSGSTVYLGGSFTQAENANGTGTDTRDNAAAVNASTGDDTAWNPAPDNTVDAIALNGSTVYLGGSFTMVTNANGTGTTTRPYAAAVDATTGDSSGWTPAANGTVEAIAVSGNTVYLGGSFTVVESSNGDGGVTRRNLAAVDTTRGFDTGWNPNAASAVYAVAVNGARMLAGGAFNSVNGQARSYAAAVDAATGQPTAWNPSPDGIVDSLAVTGNTVYLGGAFANVENATGTGLVARAHAAAVDATSGYDTGWNPSPNGTVYALVPSGSTIYLGGSFSSIEGGAVARGDAAAVDTVAGVATGWDPGLNGTVRTLLPSGTTIYLGGEFTSDGYGANTRNHAAAVNASGGADNGWNPNVNDTVVALAIAGSTVYLGGYFTTVNGATARNSAAAVDASTGIATGWNPNPSGTIGGLAVKDGSVYLEGQFSKVENATGTGTVSRSDLASVDTTNGFDTGWNPQIGVYLQPTVITVKPNNIGATGQLTFAADGTLYAAGFISGGFASFSVAPVNTAAPAIGGTAALGQTLSCSSGIWMGTTPQTYAYQWQRSGVAINGATASTHAVGPADLGSALTCAVTATNIRAAVTATSSPVGVAVPPAPALPSGPPARPAPNSNFELLHAPYVNTTTGAVGLYDMFHNPGTLTWHVYFHNGDTGVVIAATARRRCPAFQVRLKHRCRPEWILFGQGSRRVAGPGPVHFSISPSAAARRALRAARRRHLGGLPVAVVVTFQSAYGGSPVTHIVRVRVPLHWH